MFAHHGYSTVSSIRDIAKQVKIKSASIYALFSSKEEIFDIIIKISKTIILVFISDLKKAEEVTNFEQMLDYLLAKLKYIYDICITMAYSLITTEQFSNEKSRDIFNNVLLKTGINYRKAKFDECIKKNWLQGFDTNDPCNPSDEQHYYWFLNTNP